MTILKKNGYPNDIIHRALKPKRRRTKNINPVERVYLKLPFLNDRFYFQVQRIFQKADLPVRVYDRNLTLRQALSQKSAPRKCSKKDCSIQNSNLCFVKKCVYKLTCVKCNSSYIGSTLRDLHSRVKEHMDQANSSVFQHRRLCDATFSVQIMHKASDNPTLRFLEALSISKSRPEINNRQESEGIRHLLFE